MSEATSAKNMKTEMKPLAEFFNIVTIGLSLITDMIPPRAGGATGSAVCALVSVSPTIPRSASSISAWRSRCILRRLARPTAAAEPAAV